MKYKIGDKVRIKSLDWFNTNRCGGPVICDGFVFLEFMSEYCGKELTIDYIYTNSNGKQAYVMKETNTAWRFTDSMIESLADKPQEKMVSLDRACEWLELHINDDKYYSCIGEETLIPYLIDDFKKAMEE